LEFPHYSRLLKPSQSPSFHQLGTSEMKPLATGTVMGFHPLLEFLELGFNLDIFQSCSKCLRTILEILRNISEILIKILRNIPKIIQDL
jgi:hypothetical protein